MEISHNPAGAAAPRTPCAALFARHGAVTPCLQAASGQRGLSAGTPSDAARRGSPPAPVFRPGSSSSPRRSHVGDLASPCDRRHPTLQGPLLRKDILEG